MNHSRPSRSNFKCVKVPFKKFSIMQSGTLSPPIITRKSETGKKAQITQEIKEKMKYLLGKDPCLTAKQLKGRIAGLATVSIRRIQEA